MYVCIELDEDQKCLLAQEIISANDLCSRCGRDGHFIKDCYAKNDINGNVINDESSDDSSDDELIKNQLVIVIDVDVKDIIQIIAMHQHILKDMV
jgi:hypothetical protein